MSDSNPQRLPIAVLVSGTGRSLANLIERAASGELHVDIRLVISNTPRAGGLEHARAAGIECAVVDRKEFPDDDSFGQAVFAVLRKAEIDLVVMAGFLKFLPIPDDYENRVVNIHPALIPAFCGQGFYGQRVHQAVLDYGAKVTGCTVHFVDNQFDHGPIILQRTVPVQSSDTPATLAARVFEAELEALPHTLNLIAAGRVHADGRRVQILDDA